VPEERIDNADVPGFSNGNIPGISGDAFKEKNLVTMYNKLRKKILGIIAMRLRNALVCKTNHFCM
jgi:hypothetical protein